MDMKWHPIKDGNMEELNGSAQYIFTVEIIPMEGKPRRLVTIGEPYEMSCMKFLHPDVREVEYKAWAEVPEPYMPGRCDICNYYHMWIDGFGDHWSECRLGDKVFSKGGCPLEN